MRKRNHGLLVYIITLKIQAFMTVCYQYRILDFANQTTVRWLPALPHQFGTCDHQDAFSVDRKDEKHLALSQVYTMDVQDTPTQISVTRLPLLGCVGSSAFKLKDMHWSESGECCGEWLVLCLVFRSCKFGCCMVYTCRFSLFSSLAAELIDWLICNWVRDLMVPMHLGLNWWAPLCLISINGSPHTLLKFQIAPRLYTLDVLWLQEEGAQIHMSQWSQSFTLTESVDRGFNLCTTPPTQWIVWQSH